MGLFTSSWERQVDDNLFDYIDVDQFKNRKAGTIWNYFVMIFLLVLSFVFYAVDIYTCIKLLAFNEWSSQVKPNLPFKISKWLFAACIIVSIVLLIYELVRGIKVFRTRNISLIYTNTAAKSMKSIQGYKYFCVLNEINPSSGFDKMAFYTYFTFHGSKKLILADSPRQVINALTLYSVLNVQNGFVETLEKIQNQSPNEAIILYAMTVSFAIWLFFIFQFFFAIVFAIPVLHRILLRLKYKALRQYVCIKVDHTVKKLARHYQKKSLRKLVIENQKNYKPTLPDVDPLSFTPTIPNKPSTFSSLNSLSNSTLQNENPFSDDKHKLYEMTNFKQAVSDPMNRYNNNNNESVSSFDTQYYGASRKQPPKIDYKPSITSLNTSTTLMSSTSTAVPIISKPTPPSRTAQYKPSYSSLATIHDNGSQNSITTKPEPVHFNDLLYPKNYSTESIGNNFRKPSHSSSSDQSIVEPEKALLSNHNNQSDPESLPQIFDSDLSDDEFESERYNNSSTNLSRGSKKAPVRESLIRRAQDMRSEDYTRFNPLNSQNSSNDSSRSNTPNSNSRNGSNPGINVFQNFQGRRVL
ncbi:putative membrane protein [Wickerhamomyces ciferrii]|uniref:Membrane protein n=1 Tax=Wickerhamomyces ciferrii (strain ATCC 14091 / BCRC 22168 / CBS 111 / JCM 3599 / NBRC 0793 / NRRL Y-1031 F-60-10) TaxID=1206466 RepID=K0KHW2_WICCF|nr:uncharacterized protein BN7_526 [Wickerhamomyces ciferrii]CCH40989.1 putative membrane protein [Wickerhamomyces ciferrii]